MTFLQLEYFHAVAQSGSISRTAERYNISPAALSRSISQLERELGAELFNHQGRSIVLNECGEIFLQCAEEVLDSMESARKRISYMNKHNVIRLRLDTVLDEPGELPIVFKMARPDLIVEILASNKESSRYDMRIFESANLISKPNYELLFDDRYVAALPIEHPLASRTEIDLTELKDESFAICRNGQHEEAVVEMCREAGFNPRIYLTFGMMAYQGLRRSVEEGIAVSLVPELVSRAYWNLEKVALVPLSNILRMRHIYAAAIDGEPLDENCRFVCNIIHNQLKTARSEA